MFWLIFFPLSGKKTLNVQFCVLGVTFDKLSPGPYFIAHQHAENAVGFGGAFNGDLLESSCIRIHSRFPKLIGIHFTEPFVALNRYRFFLSSSYFFHQCFTLFFIVSIGMLLSSLNKV